MRILKSIVLFFFMINVLLLSARVEAQNPGSAATPPAPADSKVRSRQVSTKPSTAETQESAEQDSEVRLRQEIERAATTPDRTQRQFKLIDYLVSRGMRLEAIQELHSMISEDRFDPQAFYNMGNALARLGDSDKSIEAYRKAIAQRKGHYSRALNNLGVVLLRLGRWDEAMEALLSALRLENFRYAEASYNLGRLYAARGETDLAQREWRRAVVIDPEHTAAAHELSTTGGESPLRVAAAPSVRTTRPKTSNKFPIPNEPSAASVARSSNGSVPSARSAASSSLTVDPETFNYLQRARNARERNRNQEAVGNYERVISRMGGYFAPANLEMSYALIALDRRENALSNLLQVAQKDGPRYPISYYHLARLYELRGELKLAEENYGRVAELYENNAQFLLDLSRVREKLGDLPGAIASMEEYVRLMEKQNHKPEWSDSRLTSLRHKLASSSAP